MSEYYRVLQFATDPTREEMVNTGVVAGASIVVIGFIGYVMYALMSVLPF